MVDLRPGSASRDQWLGVELSAQSERLAYVPEGFAQGYQTLEDDTEVLYQMSHHYVPEAARGVRWDDPVAGHRLALRRRAHHLGARSSVARSPDLMLGAAPERAQKDRRTCGPRQHVARASADVAPHEI